MIDANRQNLPTTSASSWYLEAMENLVRVVQALSHARDNDAIAAIVRDAARNLTGADGASFILRDNDQCYYVDENAIEPLWKGKRFPMNICASGWVMRNAQPVVIEDIYKDPRVPVEVYQPTFVKSMAMVPIRQGSPIGVIGNYWASQHTPLPEEMSILQALADTTSVALENADLYGKLQKQVQILQTQQDRITEQHNRLETFTRALSHDLKEPVRTMISFSKIIHENKEEPEVRETSFRYIQNAAQRMGMLIDAVYQYTQLDIPEQQIQESCSLNDVLNDVKDNLAQLTQEHSARLICEDMPTVGAHPIHMLQVMQNLVANAIQHNKKPVMVHVKVKAQNGQWLFSVSDNGVGIDPKHLETIFLPFKRLTHEEGHAGLGLATTTKIINSYGGKVWCESTPGSGATFYFTLPQTTDQTETKQPLANVLLVDDLESDIELMQRAFRHAKIECNLLSAHDGVEALEILKENAAQNKINLILLDINMPCMDGFELLSTIRQNAELEETTVIMCSGSVYERDKARAKELGADGYMVKPPSMDQLCTIIKEIPGLWVRPNKNNSSQLVRTA